MKPSKQWRKVVEFTIVTFATWLNPQAGLLIFLLKLSFQILWALQDQENDRAPKSKYQERSSLPSPPTYFPTSPRSPQSTSHPDGCNSGEHLPPG
jgi:hypothetical protein